MLLGGRDEGVVVDTAGADEDHAIGDVVGLDVVDQIGALDRHDALLRTEDRPSERVTLEGDRVQVIEHDLLGQLVDLFLLPEDHVSLRFHRRGVQLGVLKDVR